MKQKYTFFLLLCTVALGLSGCFGPKPVTSGSITTKNLGKDVGIQVVGEFGADGTLSGLDSDLDLYFSRQSFTLNKIKGFNQNGINEIQLEISNKTSKPISVSYQFEWFDALGKQIEPGTAAASQIQLPNKATKNIVKASPRTGIKSFRILLKEYK